MDVSVREVIRPASLAEAVAALAARHDAQPIAGGTDLLVQLRDGRRRVGCLVDLGRLGLEAIAVDEAVLELGAASTMDAIARDRRVRRFFPALAEAASGVGAWPIQCRATLGGNLANASPAADTAPALLVAEARLALVSAAGRRQLSIAEFFLAPGRSALAPAELIASVLLPLPSLPAGSRAVERFDKVGPRREQVVSVVSLAGRIVIAGDRTVQSVRVALGAVAPTPVRALAVERALTGRRIGEATRREAARVLQDDIAPIDDVRAPASYRRIAAAVLLDRFLAEADRG